MRRFDNPHMEMHIIQTITVVNRLETKELWEPYLRFRPLEVDDSDEQFEAFLKGESSCCDMCPAHLQRCDMGDVDPQVLKGSATIAFGYKTA